MTQIIDTNNFESELENGVVAVDFFATWCGPCKMLAPIFDELETEMKDSAKFFKVEIDQNMDLARKFMVSTVPTIMIFKDGKPVETMVGFMPKETIKTKVEAHI
ncbi:thioredoxin [Romboutsia sedimentorum]|uniref:thioredoxin n=1 Tax=Romboutsia sedimentorum TaxID=1368474 RepID=UPI0024DE0F2B|nr:thioredoxin [Romboutsia sedimentorum]MDK2584319.1 thioredoxin [Romboutsia sedimentorum]